MKKVLLIGVSGFIGENLYDYLSPNYKVYGISRSNVTYDNCEQLDVSNKTELLNYFRNKILLNGFLVHLESAYNSKKFFYSFVLVKILTSLNSLV